MRPRASRQSHGTHKFVKWRSGGRRVVETVCRRGRERHDSLVQMPPTSKSEGGHKRRGDGWRTEEKIPEGGMEKRHDELVAAPARVVKPKKESVLPV